MDDSESSGGDGGGLLENFVRSGVISKREQDKELGNDMQVDETERGLNQPSKLNLYKKSQLAFGGKKEGQGAILKSKKQLKTLNLSKRSGITKKKISKKERDKKAKALIRSLQLKAKIEQQNRVK